MLQKFHEVLLSVLERQAEKERERKEENHHTVTPDAQCSVRHMPNSGETFRIARTMR